MHTAVIIPFRDRGDRGLLEWTLEGYARQKLGLGHTMEVRIGVDGGAGDGAGAIVEMDAAIPMVMHVYERMGAAGVRNALVQEVSGKTELLVIGNADARPAEDMVQRHIDAMAGLPERSVVLGSAPWEVPASGATVMDALLAETPMVFFYNQLKGRTWYGFRHCWTLNLSVRREDFLACGGFHEQLRPVYYEDLAFAHRLMGKERKGVWYEPGAKVLHRHPTTLAQYLDREELLGLMAPVLARVCPEAFAALHGTADAEALAGEFRAWVKMDGAMQRWVYARLKAWAGLPEGVLGEGVERERVLMTLYQMHVPLKRLAFRLGYLRGMGLVGDEHWEERNAVGLWRGVVEG